MEDEEQVAEKEKISEEEIEESNVKRNYEGLHYIIYVSNTVSYFPYYRSVNKIG